MPLIILGLGIILLFLLIVIFNLNAFLSLLITSIFVGISLGMDPLTIVESIEAGLGGILGHIAIIIGLGVIFGQIISEGGGAHRIARTLIDVFGKQNVDWAITVASFVLGIILFFEVSFILLIPIVYVVVKETNTNFLKVALPFLAAVSITHVFLPPHPGPTAVAYELNANLGVVLFYGLILSIPAVVIFGPIFAKFYRHWDIKVPDYLVPNKEFNMNEVPSITTSIIVTLSPVFLILIGVISEFTLAEGSTLNKTLTFIGNADIALLISVFIAMYVFGIHKKRKSMKELMEIAEKALVSMGGILFIVGGGGAFKEVIVDSGMADYIAEFTSEWNISPYILAWIVAAILRLAVGSATVTVLTASGVMIPIIAATGATPELMVIAITSASIAWGPPSDVAFWFAKEYFNLTMIQTVKSVCVMFTLLALYGLLGVIILSTVIG